MVALAKTKRTEDWPVYWFAKLELAVERGDHAAAAQVQRELKRLGVEVRYGRPLDPALITATAQEFPHAAG